MIAFYIILYILIGCVIGCAICVFLEDGDEDYDVAGIFGGILWPLTIVFIIICTLFTFICSRIYRFFKRIKKEGFHYYKGDLEPCCGQCKHICYYNNHDELNECHIRKHIVQSCTAVSCEHFKKDPF